jgi:hypothetical protein
VVLVTLCKRSLLALLLLCVGCSAQSNTPNDVERRIERQLRAVYQVPDQVDIKLGARTASEFPDYDK